MKTKQGIIGALEFHAREIEIAYLKTQDVLAEAIEYVRNSRDQHAEDVEQGKRHDLEKNKEKRNES